MKEIKYNLTTEGKKKLEEELALLEGPRTEENIARLRHAIEMGDLSENADYTAAKEDQAFIVGRIQEIKAILRDVDIIDDNVKSEKIVLGSKFVISIDSEETETYKLVGAAEANPREGKISDRSPIGKALIGATSGQTVYAKSPAGNMKVTIHEIL